MMPEMASREPPVGSSDSDSYHDTIVLNQPKSDPDQYRVKQLEEERDNLQKNMISLTSRLAQVKNRCPNVRVRERQNFPRLNFG